MRPKSVVGKEIAPLVEKKAPKKPLKQLDKEVQFITRPRRRRKGLNSHELIPREFDSVVYFVHQVGEQERTTSVELERTCPKLVDKQLRMRQYSRRVKQYFTPVQDKQKALNVHLRTETFISLKRLQEMPRMKLFRHKLITRAN